jgi:hypothetical protein
LLCEHFQRWGRSNKTGCCAGVGKPIVDVYDTGVVHLFFIVTQLTLFLTKASRNKKPRKTAPY